MANIARPSIRKRGWFVGLLLSCWVLGAVAPARAAVQLPEAMPPGTLLYVGWPGVGKCAETSKDTGLAKLLAEEEIARFRERVLPGVDRFIRSQINEAGDLEAYQVVKGLLMDMWQYPTALSLVGVDVGAMGPQVDAALVIQAGEGAAQLARGVDTLLKLAELPIHQVIEVEVGSLKLKQLAAWGPTILLRWGVVEDLFVLSIGPKTSTHLAALYVATSPASTSAPATQPTAEQVANQAANTTPKTKIQPTTRSTTQPTTLPVAEVVISSLATSDRFTAAMNVVGGSASTPTLFMDIKGIIKTLEIFQPMFAGFSVPVLSEPGGVQKVLDGLGLGSVQSLSMALVPEAGGFKTSVFLHAPKLGQGASRLFVQESVTDGDLQVVPKDATWATVTNVDLAGMYNSLLNAVQTLSPELHARLVQVIEPVEKQLGMKLGKDVLGAFGDTWAFFDAPSNGGFWFLGATAVADVKPVNRLDGALRLIVRAMALAMGDDVNVTLRTERYRNTKITFVNVANAPMPIAPAWTEYNDRWIGALYPQIVRATLDRMMDKSDSLLDNEDFQRGRKLIPHNAQSITYIDTQAGIRQLYSLMLPIAQMLMAMGQGEGLELDVSVMPTANTLTKHLFGNVSATTKTEEGYLTVSHGALPFGTPAMTHGTVTVPLMAGILLPSLARARELAKRTASAANLQGIGSAMHVYAVDHDERFPPNLETLITQGGVSPKMLKSLLDKSDREISYVYIAGQAVNAPPDSVLAYEYPENYKGEGTNVLFGDGHVEFMTMERFEEALARTKARLGQKGQTEGRK